MEAIAKPKHLIPANEFMQNIAETNWLIENILPEDGIGELWGASGSYKSFIMLDMAFCIACGTSWHGFETKQGKVVYVAGEAPKGVAKRIKALSIHYGLETDNLLVFPKPSNLYNLDELKVLLDDVKLETNEEKIALIIFDTLHRNSAGAREDSADDWAVILNNLDSKLKPLSNFILWVHHSGVNADKSRGTTSRFAGADWSAKVERQEDKRATLTNDKQKDDEAFQTMAFNLIPIDLDFNGLSSLVPVNVEHTMKENKRYLNREQTDMIGIIRLAVESRGIDIPKEFKERENITQGKCILIDKALKEDIFKVLQSTSKDDDPTKVYDAKRKKYDRYKKELIKNKYLTEYDNYILINEDCIFKYS